APARIGRTAPLHLLHDLRPEDHAARPCGTPGLRQLRRRARLLPSARRVRAEPDHLGAVPLRPARPPSRLVRGAPRFQKGAAMRRVLFLAFALTAAAPSAHAFCGFFVGKADTELFNKSSQVALVRDGNRTVLTMSNDYKGPAHRVRLGGAGAERAHARPDPRRRPQAARAPRRLLLAAPGRVHGPRSV